MGRSRARHAVLLVLAALMALGVAPLRPLHAAASSGKPSKPSGHAVPVHPSPSKGKGKSAPPLGRIVHPHTSSYSTTVSNNNPKAYWRLGEGSGNFADSTSNGNTATTHGTITYSATGAINGDGNTAVTLDGSSGYAEAADSASLDAPTSAITVEAWANPSTGQFSSGNYKYIVQKGFTAWAAPYVQYGLDINDATGSENAAAFGINTGGTVNWLVIKNSGWSYGSWNHFVGTYDGSTMRLYINGQLVGNTSATGSITTYATPIDIGAYAQFPKDADHLFKGGIDEVAVYPSALTMKQLQTDYSYAFASQGGASTNTSRYTSAVTADSPKAYWRLDEVSPGPYARDRTSNGNDGIVSSGGVSYNQPSGLASDPDASATFDGSSGYVGVPDSASLNAPTSAITLEAWVNPTSGQFSDGNYRYLVQKAFSSWATPFVQYGLGINDYSGTPNAANFVLSIGGAAASLSVNNVGWAYGAWNHIVGTYDGANMKLYVNDVLKGTQAQTGSINTYTWPLALGAYVMLAKDSSHLLKGGLDEAAVYSTALPAARVDAHFTASGHQVSLNGGSVPDSYHLGAGNKAGACSNGGSQQGSGGDPVDTESGNFAETFTDIAIQGRSCPLEIARTYNSATAATAGAFGYGWTYNYAMSLACSGTTATITQENGSTAQFTTTGSCSSGTWTPMAPRYIATLSYAAGTWTFKRQNRDTYTFNSSGQLTTTTDLNGYVTTFTYTSGNLTTITDPAGRTLTLAWTGSHITSLTDANVSPTRTVSYTYNGGGELTDVTDVMAGDASFAYDGSHRVTTIKDPKCQALGAGCPGVQNHYDGSGRVDWQKDQLNRQTSFAYAGSRGNASGGTTTITDPKGNVVVDGYEYGVRTYQTRGYGTSSAATTYMQYDPDTLALTSIVDPKGNTTTLTVDSSGNVLTKTDPLGRVTTMTYNSFNEPLTVQDGNLKTTTMTYDANGNLATTSRPVTGTSCPCQVTTYNHANATFPGDVTTTVDPDNKTWSYHYDANGYQDQVKDPLGNVAGTVHNAVGWATETYTPKASCTWNSSPPTGCSATYKTAYSYLIPGGGGTTNEFGDVQTITDPLSHVTTIGYDADRNKTSVKDANGNTTTYTFDKANQMTTATRADTTTQVTDYNSDGSVLDQKDGKGNAIQSYTYDSLGRVITVTDALNCTTTVAYDLNGNALTKQDPGATAPCTAGSSTGGTTTMTYNADNEPTTVSYSDGVTPNITSITYDSVGQRTGMSDGTGSPTWSFDNLHRLTSSTNGNGTSLSYVYNLRNEPTTITYPGSHAVTRAYDDAGRLTSVQDWLGTPNTTSFGYDVNSNLVTDTFQNGAVDTYTYNAANQMTAISDVKSLITLFSATYTRDSNAQLGSDSSVPATQGAYKYTSLNQLCYGGSASTTACSSPPVGSNAYGFDSADNLTTNKGNAQQFNAADELCWTATGASGNNCATVPTGATSYNYDTRGNQTAHVPAAGSATCDAYDQANRLTKIQTGTGSSCTSPTTVGTYAYDGNGLRQSKTVSGTTTQFLWGGSLLLQEKAGGASPTSYIYGPGGLPVEQIDTAGTAHFYHHDQLGSTRAISSTLGVAENTYTYDPYGIVTASTGTVANNLQFCGEYKDGESSLTYLRARYYDPTTAQFLTRDPMVASTRSAYAYVQGNPLNGTDPSGLCDWYAVVVCGVQGAAGVVHDHIIAPAIDAVPNCTIFDDNCAPVIKSASVCANASVFGGIGHMGSVCAGETNGYQHGGLTYSGGIGLGLGASLSGGIAISNANCLQDYGGPFVEVGGGAGPASGSLQVSPDGKTRVGYGGLGISTPQGYGGFTLTGIWQWW